MLFENQMWEACLSKGARKGRGLEFGSGYFDALEPGLVWSVFIVFFWLRSSLPSSLLLLLLLSGGVFWGGRARAWGPY